MWSEQCIRLNDLIGLIIRNDNRKAESYAQKLLVLQIGPILLRYINDMWSLYASGGKSHFERVFKMKWEA